MNLDVAKQTRFGKLIRFLRFYPERILTGCVLALTLISAMSMGLSSDGFAILDTDFISGNSESCSFSSTVTSAHTTNLSPGGSAENIGSTKITTICPNSVDHQVYAVGYTNDTTGNTDLISSDNNTIPTGTGTGNVSNWSMKIAKDTTSYSPANLTIDTGYDAYHAVPATTARIASYTGGTDSTTGSAVLATYKAKVSDSQSSGAYTGKVKFTLTATMLYSVTIATTAGIAKVSLNGVECTTTAGCTVANLTSGQSYALVATPASGSSFVRWNPGQNGTLASATSASTTYTVGDGSSLITPIAELGTSTLQIQYGTGIASMTVNGNAVTNNGTVNLSYGTPLNISATLNPGYSLSDYTFTPLSVTSSRIAANASFTGTYIQNLSASSCATTASTVYDSRDMHAYTIQRLADGKCWMMENLDLGRTTLTTNLTSANTNIATTVTAATFNSWKKTSGTATYDTGEFINVSGTDSTSGTPYGTLYNYYAASAGTISGSSNGSNATYDICPAGWRLPTGGSSGEFQALYAKYNSNALMRASIANGGAAFALAGLFGNSTPPANQGSYGYYWSSTRYEHNNTYMYGLSFDTSNVYPVNGGSRSYGGAIRCVLDEPPTILDLTYMQDFNGLSADDKASVLASMEDSTTYTLIDNRDNKSYAIAKMKDGNIWMAENLDLGRTTLTTDLTSANTNIATTVTAATFNGWQKTSGSLTYNAGEFINVSGTDATSGTAYGTLYNYYAASAGTISGSSNSSDASYDICPAGWRLPTGGSSGEFQALYTKYNSNALMRASIENNGAAFALAGRFLNSTPASQGSIGNYWSSTRGNDANMYGLFLYTSSASPANHDGRYCGYSIRCLLGS